MEPDQMCLDILLKKLSKMLFLMNCQAFFLSPLYYK